MRKRFLLISTIIVLSAFTFAACGKKSPSSPESTNSETTTAEPTTEEPQIAEAEKIEIIPTLVLYRDGKAIDSIVAPESKIMIENFINEALEK